MHLRKIYYKRIIYKFACIPIHEQLHSRKGDSAHPLAQTAPGVRVKNVRKMNRQFNTRMEFVDNVGWGSG